MFSYYLQLHDFITFLFFKTIYTHIFDELLIRTVNSPQKEFLMYSIAKAQALVRDLSDRLGTRLAFSGTSVNSFTTGFSAPDAAGAVWPYLIFSLNGNVAEGQPVAFIEFSNPNMVSRDVFGGQTDAYAPTIAQIGYELNTTGGTFVSHADLATITYETEKTGARIQIKELANGTAVTSANVNAASPTADLEDLYWPTKSV